MNKQLMLKQVEFYLKRFFDSNYNLKIIEAMDKIDRKDFISDNIKDLVYVDNALPIGSGQTISQPSTVARMLQLLELKKGDNVLEIGSGSGWNATLIAFLVGNGKVISYEVIPEIAKFANENIKKTKLKNVKVVLGNFLNIKKKFNKIIFTAGITSDEEYKILNFAEKHLNESGILLCPFRLGPLIIIRMIDRKIKKEYTTEEYSFVPLIMD